MGVKETYNREKLLGSSQRSRVVGCEVSETEQRMPVKKTTAIHDTPRQCMGVSNTVSEEGRPVCTLAKETAEIFPQTAALRPKEQGHISSP